MGIFVCFSQIINFAICHRNKPSINPFVLLVVENTGRNKVVELKVPFCFFRANDFLMKKKNAHDVLLAETKIVMTTLISSHVKDNNCIFTGYEIFATGKILVFQRYLCNKI